MTFFQSNYRLEAIVMFAMALISIMIAFGLCCQQKIVMKQAPTQAQQAELTRLKSQDPMDHSISQRRQHLQQVKKMNRQIIKDMQNKRKDLIEQYQKDIEQTIQSRAQRKKSKKTK